MSDVLEVNNSKTNLQKTEPDVDKLKALAKKLLQQKQQCQSEIKQLKKDNTKYRKNLEDDIQRFEELQQSYNDLSERTKQIENENDSLKEQLRTNNLQMTQQLKDIALLKESVAECQNKYDVSVAENTLEMMRKDEQIQEVNERCSALKQQNIELTAKMDAAHGENSNLLKQIQTLRKESDDSLKANEKLQCETSSKLLSATNQITSLESTIKELKKQIIQNSNSTKGTVLKTMCVACLMMGPFLYWYKNQTNPKYTKTT